MKSRFNKNTKAVGIAISYIYYFLNIVISIILSSFIIRKTGDADYGVYQSMNAFVSYLILLEFGVGTVITRNVSLIDKNNNDSLNRNISTIFILSILLSALIGLFLIAFYFLIPVFYSKTFDISQIETAKLIFIFSGLSLLSTFITSAFNGLILAFEHYAFEKTVACIKISARLILLITALKIKQYILLVPIIDCILSFTVLLITYFYSKSKINYKVRIKSFDLGILKSSLPYIFAMLIQTLANVANGNVDKFVISVIMPPQFVTIYSISMYFYAAFASIASIPVAMYMPQLATKIKKECSNDELNISIIKPCRVNLIITGLVCFGFVATGKQFISLIYGADKEEAYIFAIITMIPMFFNMWNAVIINIVDLYNKRHVRSFIQIITTSINVVLTIIGVTFFGLLGAAVSTAISLLCDIILMNIWYHTKIGINIPKLFANTFKGIFPSLLISLIISLMFSLFIQNNIASFFVSGLLFIIVFAGSMLLFGLSKEEKRKIHFLFKKSFKK